MIPSLVHFKAVFSHFRFGGVLVCINCENATAKTTLSHAQQNHLLVTDKLILSPFLMLSRSHFDILPCPDRTNPFEGIAVLPFP